MKKLFSPLRIGLLVSAIVLLPSCTQLDWLKEKLGLNKSNATESQAATMGGTPLATADGKTYMSSEEFEKKYNNFIQNHPLGAMIAQMKGIKRKIFEGLLAQKLISDYVVEQGLDKSKEYEDQLEQMKQMLNVRVFENQNPVKTSESELRKFYEDNKDKMPEAMVSAGGVKATGVSFAKEADAKAFMEKAKGKGAELEKVAKDAGLSDKFTDFKLVNKFGIGIDAGLKDKILALKKVPTLEVIKGGDNKYYVIYAASKEEVKIRPFEELKPMIEQKLRGSKQEESNAKALEELKAAKKVKIDESYFAEDEKAAQEEAQQLEQVMPVEKAEGKKPAQATKAA
jgi:hypothetical protein